MAPSREKAKRPEYETGSFRVQVRLPEDWREAVQDAADKAGKTVSQFIRDAVLEKLPAKQRKQLADVRRGRPSAGGG